MYKIVRSYQRDYGKRTIKTGLTLEEAKARCADPETSSSTCTSAAGLARTRKMGPWFDGFEEEKPKRRSGRRWPKGAVWLGDPDFAPRGARTR